MTSFLLQNITEYILKNVYNSFGDYYFFQIPVQRPVKWEQLNSNSHSFFSSVCGKYKDDCKNIESLFLYVWIKICCFHIATRRHIQAQICLKQTADGWVWLFKDIKLDWKENYCRDLLASLR